MSQGDSSEQRDGLEERLARGEIKAALLFKGDFTDSERELARRAWEAGLASAEAEVVGLSEQLAAAEEERAHHEHEATEWRRALLSDSARRSQAAYDEMREEKEVAVGRLEKAQAALRGIRDIDLSKVIGPPIHVLLEIATDALEEIKSGDALGNMTPEEKQ